MQNCFIVSTYLINMFKIFANIKKYDESASAFPFNRDNPKL